MSEEEFKQLVEELKDFYAVDDLESVMEKMGFRRVFAKICLEKQRFSPAFLKKFMIHKHRINKTMSMLTGREFMALRLYMDISRHFLAKKLDVSEGYIEHVETEQDRFVKPLLATKMIALAGNKRLDEESIEFFIQQAPQQMQNKQMLCKEFKAMRLKLRYTQNTLAKLLGITSRYVQLIENGDIDSKSIEKLILRFCPTRLSREEIDVILNEENKKQEITAEEKQKFESLLEEIQHFYGVSDVYDIGTKLGYTRSAVDVWRQNCELSRRAMERYLSDKNNVIQDMQHNQ